MNKIYHYRYFIIIKKKNFLFQVLDITNKTIFLKEVSINNDSIVNIYDSIENFLENNTVDSDIFEIIKNYQQIFYFGGNLVNVEIESQEMDAFLQNNMSSFSPIIDEIVNKIKKYKTLSS